MGETRITHSRMMNTLSPQPSAQHVSRVVRNVVELIGHSPILRLRIRDLPCELFLKLEQFNPGANVKDRAALNMIIQAEKRGDLRPGGTIIESSSGNTGLSLAMIGAARGYRVIIVVDNHVQAEKMAIMRAFGAEVEHVGKDLPPEEQAGVQREERVKELIAAIPGAFYVNQGDNLDNRAIHYSTTAEEILASVGPVDFLFASIGTGGTISGTGRRLKEVNPKTVVVGLEPVGSVFFGSDYKPFYMTGAGSTKEIWKNIDFDVIDEHFEVSDKQAFSTCLYLARYTGLLVGGTGGMVVYKLVEFAVTNKICGRAIAIVPDGGDQYISSVFEQEWMRKFSLVDDSVIAFLHENIDRALR